MIGCLTDPNKNHYMCSGEATSIIVWQHVVVMTGYSYYLVNQAILLKQKQVFFCIYCKNVKIILI